MTHKETEDQLIRVAAKLAAEKARHRETMSLLREVKTMELVPGDEADPAVGAAMFCTFCDEVVPVCDAQGECLGSRIRRAVAQPSEGTAKCVCAGTLKSHIHFDFCPAKGTPTTTKGGTTKP